MTKKEISQCIGIFHFQRRPSRGVLRKRCSETKQQIYRRNPCRSVLSIKLLRNFIEIAVRHGCSPVNLLHIFRIPFPMNTSGWLLLHFCLISLLCPINNNNFRNRLCKQFPELSVNIFFTDNLSQFSSSFNTLIRFYNFRAFSNFFNTNMNQISSGKISNLTFFCKYYFKCLVWYKKGHLEFSNFDWGCFFDRNFIFEEN